MARKIFGSVLFIFGGLLTLYFSLWSITGNHGTTWSQLLPVIAMSIGIFAFGVYLMKDKSSSKQKSTPK